jgi:hypothetical protein
VTADQLGRCDHAVSVAGGDGYTYEIGLVAQPDGSFRLLMDEWQGGYGLVERCGAGAQKLIQRYAVETARDAASAQGWITEDTADGGLTIYHPSGGSLTISPHGEVRAGGFIGSACHEPAELIARAMGRVASQHHTNDYFAERAHVRETI